MRLTNASRATCVHTTCEKPKISKKWAPNMDLPYLLYSCFCVVCVQVPKIEDIIQWATRAVQADAKVRYLNSMEAMEYAKTNVFCASQGDLENALEMYTNAANSLERLVSVKEANVCRYEANKRHHLTDRDTWK